ncbi:protein CTLA-2-alpha-like [Teleopsis dalmanni]|uniref:protein CTLA-2-alpha-like n=1 Tax=Teleopsis dalmanni TaxID=139649 RepID=UPI0018CE15DA|nr:protein CTLA-2-alpha-like [Teleopsis dalmanni]
MRSVFFIFAVFCILAGLKSSEGCSNANWRLYKMKYQKHYDSLIEDFRRRAIYCDNLQKINAHNARYKRGEVTDEEGINQFADWTHEEFVDWLHGKNV